VCRPRGLSVLAFAAACGSDNNSPTTPSPSRRRTGAGTARRQHQPCTAPSAQRPHRRRAAAAPAALSTFTISPSRVQSQQERHRYRDAHQRAPSGGITIDLSTVGPRLRPSGVELGDGARRLHDRHVPHRNDDGRRFEGRSRSRRATRASPSTSSCASPSCRRPRDSRHGPDRGEDKCTLIDNNGDNDCRVDASASSGVPRFYIYTYAIGSSTITDGKTDKLGDIDIPNACDFFKDRSTGDDNGDKYINVDVSRRLKIGKARESSVTKKTVRFYTHGILRILRQ
jgi:hypothetical protein